MPLPALGAVAAKWAAKKAVQDAVSDKQSSSHVGKIVLAIFVVMAILVVTIVVAIGSLIGSFIGSDEEEKCDTYQDGSTTTSSVALADIPPVALEAYNKAGQTSGVDWIYVAAIGKVESDHGRTGGRTLDEKGNVGPTPIEGIETKYGRAQGPMQFLSSTWKTQGKDGNNDGKRDVQNIYDAALAAAFYLKASGAPGDMDKAIFAYNHSEEYVAKVKEVAASYAGADVITGSVNSPQIGGSLTIAQANIPSRSGISGLNSSLARVTAQNPDLISLNEMFSTSVAQAENAAPGYTAWRDTTPKGNDPGASETFDQIVMWKSSDYSMVSGARIKIIDDDKTKTKNGLTTWDRFALWVTLKRKSDGALLSFISTHMPTNPGKYGPNLAWRQGKYAAGMDAVIAKAAELSPQGPVFVAGDMNVHTSQTAKWTAPSKMRAAGYDWHNYELDYVFFPAGSGVTKTGGADGAMASDHHWVVARLNLGKAGAGGTGGIGGPGPGISDAELAAISMPASMTNPLSNGAATRTMNRFLKMTEDSDNDGGDGGWTLPMAPNTYTLTARWGQAGSMWSSGYHTGLDFAAPVGTPVFAAATGNVIARPDQASWAGVNFLTIDHGTIAGQQVSTWYAHLSEAVVTSGQVAGGTLIGKVGELGNVSGPHLHFEVRVGGKDVDPQIWLASAGSPDPTGIASDGCGPTGTSGIIGENGAWGGYENGKIPLSALCEANFQTNLLFECNTAKAIDSLNAAYKAKFGYSLSPVGGYRDYAGQVQCQAEKGSLCAKPGTSNHGWGLAADFSNGKFQSFDTPDYKWMLKNAPAYGFVAPDWARANGSKPEPWHWEFASSTSPTNTGSTLPTPAGATAIRVASWNVLGASHTEGPGCNKCPLPDSGPRMDRAVQVIKGHGLEVIGLQEFQPKQQTMFRAKMPNWGVFSNADNAVAWDKSKFVLVSSRTFTIPYFGGSNRLMPVVRLRHLASGKVIEVISVHNPADVRGPAQQYRDRATATEGTITSNTAAQGIPVILTGDANDRERFFCQITGYGVMASSSGGSNVSGQCTPPGHMAVDWVMGSKKNVVFLSHQQDDKADVDFASDHPIIVTTAAVS